MTPETLVFLPGTMCDARLFAPQMFEMAPERSVVMAPVTVGERIEEIASTLLDGLPRRFAVCGQGLGGMVAIDIMRRAPDRVSRLALIATNALQDTPQESARRESWIVAARTGRLTEAMAELIPADALAPGADRAAIRALLDDMAAFLGPDTFVRQMRMLQKRRDLQAALRRCKVPALMIAGSEDRMFPVKRMEFLAEFTPYAQLSVIEGAGHYPSLETPAALTQVLRAWMAAPLVLS